MERATDLMSRLRVSKRTGILVSAVAALALAATGGTVLAGHLTSGVASYTGCLVPNDGVIIKVKEGDAPTGACVGGMTEVHLSGGDITKISVTGALTGGGDNGEVTIGLKPEFTLPSACASGQVAKWDGSAWSCAADDDTTYTAGTGLTLSGTELGLAPEYRVKNSPDCPTGEYATGFDAGGAIQCAAPANDQWALTSAQVNFANGDGVPDDDVRHTYVTLKLPAGKYLLEGKGVMTRGDDDIGFERVGGEFGCGLSLGGQSIDESRFTARDNEPRESYGFALMGALNTQGGDLILWCNALNDADLVAVRNARVVATKIG